MEKLSQEEIDALIMALEEDTDDVIDETPEPKADVLEVKEELLPFRKEAVNGGSQRKQRVRTYDFRSPDKFSKEQIRTMLLLHESFTRNAATALSAYVRSAVQIESVHIGQGSYMQWSQQVADPTILAIIELHPLSGPVLMELSIQTAFPILDRLLGGRGSITLRQRSLTDIETKVVQRVLQILLHAWVDAWKPVSSFEAEIRSLEGSPLFAQLIPPGEMVISLVFDVTVSGMQGELRLCLPYMMLEPVLPKLSARSWFTRDGQQELNPMDEGLRTHLQSVDVDLHVELPGTQITVRELVGLSVGDVIALPGKSKEDLMLHVNGVPKFRVAVGTVGKQLAARIRTAEEA